MSANYAAVLFNPDGTPTALLIAFWRARSPAVALTVLEPLVDGERVATDVLRRLWRYAFPSRGPLPEEPIADKAGIGTKAFWDAFA